MTDPKELIARARNPQPYASDMNSEHLAKHLADALEAALARLEKAEAVCEAMDVAGYLKHEGPHVDAWQAWRSSRGQS